MRIVPRTLFWRLALLLVAVVLIGQVAALLLFRQDRAQLLAEQFTENKITQIQALRAALADPNARERAGALLRLGRAFGARIVPAADRPTVGLPVQDPAVLRLQQRLASALGEEVEVRIAPRMGLLWIRLLAGDTGFWVGFPLPPPQPENAFPTRLIVWTLIILAALLTAAYFFARRLNAPLRDLGAAVSAVGAGQYPPELPETGPTEIRTLNQGFNRMIRTLRRIEQDRALLLAGVSHDLRTPLARLRLGVEMVSADDTLRNGLVDDIEEMDRNLAQFLDFARGDEGAPREPVALETLAGEVVERYRREGKEVSVQASTTPPVPLRVQSVKRMLQNLIDNALRYGSPSVEIVAHAEPGLVVLDVCDRGPGIPAGEVERLKQPFTRLDHSRTGPSGSGLGLAIVDRIATMHGGAFDLLPRPNGGTIARVTFPMHAPDGGETTRMR